MYRIVALCFAVEPGMGQKRAPLKVLVKYGVQHDGKRSENEIKSASKIRVMVRLSAEARPDIVQELNYYIS